MHFIHGTGIHDVARRVRHILTPFIAVMALVTGAAGLLQDISYSGDSLRPLPDPIYGVTVDAIDQLSAIVTSLDSLAHMSTTRIVFDEFVPATQYVNAVNK